MSTDKITTSIDIDIWIDAMRAEQMRPYKLDKTSEALLKQLIELTDSLSSVDDSGERTSYFIKEKASTYDEYACSQRKGIEPEEYEFYGVTDKELKRAYSDEMSQNQSPYKWYEIYVAHVPAKNKWPEYIGVSINNNYVLQMNDVNAYDTTRDAAPLLNYLIDKTKEVIEAVQENTYNADVAKNLPYDMRYGIINRKKYWDMFPKIREDFREGLTDDEINQFIKYAHEDTVKEYPDNCINNMTSRKYFEAVGTAIKSVPYKDKTAYRFQETEEEYQHYKGTEFDGTTPRELYTKYADGRDDGLTSLPLDDSAAFEEWSHHKGSYYVMNGGHPWEVRTSFSISFSIHIFPQQVYKNKDVKNFNFGVPTNKWYFLISGSSLNSSYEVVKYYLALKKHGIPVMLENMGSIAARYEESDNIGFIPKIKNAFLSTYVPSQLKGKRVVDVENLWPSIDSLLSNNEADTADDAGKLYHTLVNQITWLPEKPVALKSATHG